jgi:hypothetical protein
VQLNWTALSYPGLGTTLYHRFRGGVPIWTGMARGHNDSGLRNHVTVSYKVAAENEIGMGPNCAPAASIPIAWQEQTVPPYPDGHRQVPGQGRLARGRLGLANLPIQEEMSRRGIGQVGGRIERGRAVSAPCLFYICRPRL